MNITTDIQQPYLVVDIVLVIITKSKQSSTHADWRRISLVGTVGPWCPGTARQSVIQFVVLIDRKIITASVL